MFTYYPDNPVVCVDGTGLERIVVSGGVTQDDYRINGGRYEEFKYQFIETALKDIKSQVSQQIQIRTDTFGTIIDDEKITWMIVNYGYSSDDLVKFNEAADLWGVELIMIDSVFDFINYVNTKNTEGGSNISRLDDPITRFSNYSHGLINVIGWGYNVPHAELYTEGLALNFYTELIELLDPAAFKDCYSIFYSCNTGSESGGASFAQEWVNKTNGVARAVVDGQTSYKYINVAGINLLDWLDKFAARESRNSHGFSYSGSVNYPIAALGIIWNDFQSQ